MDWSTYAEKPDLRAVIDPADVAGHKNRYINLLHHKILREAFGEKFVAEARFHGKSFLDLGCGIGRFNALLQGYGAQVIGVDSCQAMLDRNPVKTVCAPLIDLPFPNESFDFCLSVWTLQYLPLRETIREIARVLKPGGHIFLIEQISSSGYGSVFGRSTSDYVIQFLEHGLRLQRRRPIMYAFDRVIDLVRVGIIPEWSFDIVADIHLGMTRTQRVPPTGYVDYFQEFKKTSWWERQA